MPRRYRIVCALLSGAAYISAALFALTCDAAPAVAATSAVIGCACAWASSEISEAFEPEYYDHPEQLNK